ncbi:MAG: Uma2 family endonuclease [Cyanobacteria bacterium CRU_2_1]|nr:Uma2 family endonuclease [Cyanobacteria bacterium CRU_2_1]
MYDLPSEDPEEPGLPDEYHALQPQLLSRTFQCPRYPADRVFMGSDLNLYFNIRRPQWYKRPDWFLVVDISRLYDEVDLRSSYVMWQEGVSPFVVVELLSPGTEKEDLGEYSNTATEVTEADLISVNAESGNGTDIETEPENAPPRKDPPPRKWNVYEQILRVPYYIVFSRYTNQPRFFQLMGGHYQEQTLDPVNPRIWIAELELGLGLWQGKFEGIDRLWLRWYDEQGNWVPTDTEQEQQRAEQAEALLAQERQRTEQERSQLIERLRAKGLDPDEFLS